MTISIRLVLGEVKVVATEAAKAAAITRWSAPNAAVLVNMLQLLSQALGKLARSGGR